MLFVIKFYFLSFIVRVNSYLKCITSINNLLIVTHNNTKKLKIIMYLKTHFKAKFNI